MPFEPPETPRSFARFAEPRLSSGEPPPTLLCALGLDLAGVLFIVNEALRAVRSHSNPTAHIARYRFGVYNLLTTGPRLTGRPARAVRVGCAAGPAQLEFPPKPRISNRVLFI